MPEGENPTPVGDPGRKPVDIEDVVDKTVRRVYADTIATKYIECPGCGNLIIRKYGECHKCRLTYNPADNTWKPTDAVDEDPEGTSAEAGDDSVGTII